MSLLSQTVGQSLQTTVNKWPDREAVVFLQDGVRKTFSQFQHDVGCVNPCILLYSLEIRDGLIIRFDISKAFFSSD